MARSDSALRLLRSRRLWPLCLSQACGAFDDNLLKNAMIALAAFRVGNAGAGFAAMAGALFIAPYLLLSATGGQIADRYSKRIVIVWIKLAEIPLMLGAAVGFLAGNMNILLITLFGVGVQAALFGPVKYGLLPQHLREEELVGGNGVIEASTFLTILVGTVSGSVVLLPRGPEIVAVVGICSAVMGMAASFLIPQAAPADPGAAIDWNIFRATFAVVNAVRPNRRAWWAILGNSWFWTMGASIIAEFPALARDSLGSGGQVVSLLLGAFAVGVGVGSMLSARLLHGDVSARHVPYAALGMTVFCWDLGHASLAGAHLPDVAAVLASPQGWRILVDLTGLAGCGGLFAVPLNAIMQDAAPVESRARTVAANNVMNALFMVASAGVVAALAAAGLSAPAALEWLAGVNLLVAVGIAGFTVTPWPFAGRNAAAVASESGPSHSDGA